MENHLNQAVYELTLKCNLACQHCGSFAGLPRKNELMAEESLRVIQDLSDLGVEMITLNGGEPFLNPNWKVIAKTIKDYGVELAFISNGYHIPEPVFHEISRLEIYEIGISLDGGKETHDSIRGRGSFDQVLTSIAKFHEMNVNVGVITTVSKMNLNSLDETLEVVLENGIDAWQIQAAIPMGRMSEAFVLSNLEYKRVVDFIHRVRTLYPKEVYLNGGDCMGIGAKSLVTSMDYSNGNCGAGISVVGIRSDGDVVGCLSMMKDDYVEGNVRERSLKEIWLDEEAFSYNRKPSIPVGKCASCEQFTHCQAGCKSMNIASGNINESPYCMRVK